MKVFAQKFGIYTMPFETLVIRTVAEAVYFAKNKRDTYSEVAKRTEL